MTRDERGRFVAGPKQAEVIKPWGILATSRRKAGDEMRAANRRKGLKTAIKPENRARFATREEAETFLESIGSGGRWLYTVDEF